MLEKVTIGLFSVSTISPLLLMLSVALVTALKHSVPSGSTKAGNVILHLKVCLHVTHFSLCPTFLYSKHCANGDGVNNGHNG